jgi:TolB protein
MLGVGLVATSCSGSGTEPAGEAPETKAEPIASITKIEGDSQSGAGGMRLPARLTVRVADSLGRPVAGAAVTYSILRGGGRIDESAVLTSPLGIAASAPWTLGPDATIQEVLASAGTVATVFSALARDWPPFLFEHDGQLTVNDRGEEVRLTDGYQPAWSPDGGRIAFVRRSGGRNDVYVMNADGSDVVNRTVDIPEGSVWGFHSPAWSPDGRKLAVTFGDAVYTGSIYVLSAVDDGTDPLELSELGMQPAWSPDGARIAFVSLSGDDGYHELQVMSAGDGSGVTAVTQRDAGAIDHPNWSPDGQRIAFAKCLHGCDIHIVSAEGSDLTRLTNVGTALDPAWSPDGETIGFTTWSGRVYQGTASISVVQADTGDEVYSIALGTSVAWKP